MAPHGMGDRRRGYQMTERLYEGKLIRPGNSVVGKCPQKKKTVGTVSLNEDTRS
jgi:hypothetical protein